MLVKMTDQKAIEGLREEFRKLDSDNTGTINAAELKAALHSSDIDIKEEDIQKLIQEIDYFGN